MTGIPMLAYDHDPFAAREGRAPLRRGLPLHLPLPRAPAITLGQDEAPPSTKQGTAAMPDNVTLKLMTYLADVLDADQMKAVAKIVGGGDAPEIGEPGPPPAAAMDHMGRRLPPRPQRMTEPQRAAYAARFPNAARLAR